MDDKVKKREAMLRARLAAAEDDSEEDDSDEDDVGDAPSLLFGMAAAAAVSSDGSGPAPAPSTEQQGDDGQVAEEPAHAATYGDDDDFEDDEFEDDDDEDEDDDDDGEDDGEDDSEDTEDADGDGGGYRQQQGLDPAVAAAMAAMAAENDAVHRGEYAGNGDMSPAAQRRDYSTGDGSGGRMERPKTGRVNFNRAKQTVRNVRTSVQRYPTGTFS